MAYPVALLIARSPKHHRDLMVLLCVLPFASNFLVRVYAWMIILGPLRSAVLALRGDRRHGLRAPAVHDPAALHQSREARPDAARRGAGPRRQRLAPLLARDVPAVAAGHLLRLGAGVHPGARHVRDPRDPRRQGRLAGRQPDQGVVPRHARLAVRLDAVADADASRCWWSPAAPRGSRGGGSRVRRSPLLWAIRDRGLRCSSTCRWSSSSSSRSTTRSSTPSGSASRSTGTRSSSRNEEMLHAAAQLAVDRAASRRRPRRCSARWRASRCTATARGCCRS